MTVPSDAARPPPPPFAFITVYKLVIIDENSLIDMLGLHDYQKAVVGGGASPRLQPCQLQDVVVVEQASPNHMIWVHVETERLGWVFV